MDEPTYNPEAGLPATGDSEWEHPDVMSRLWFAGEIQAALTNLGFTPYAYDETTIITTPDGDDIPMPLDKSKRWVKGDRALLIPDDPYRPVNPYFAMCVIVAMGGE